MSVCECELREAWAEHCQAHYERSDFKRVLAWVAARFGWDLDPGPIDDSWHDTPREARDRFSSLASDSRSMRGRYQVAQYSIEALLSIGA